MQTRLAGLNNVSQTKYRWSENSRLRGLHCIWVSLLLLRFDSLDIDVPGNQDSNNLWTHRLVRIRNGTMKNSSLAKIPRLEQDHQLGLCSDLCVHSTILSWKDKKLVNIFWTGVPQVWVHDGMYLFKSVL